MKKYISFFPLIGGILAVLAGLCVFLPAVQLKVVILGATVLGDPIPGLIAAFGGEFNSTTYDFNIGAVLGFVAALAGGLLLILGSKLRLLRIIGAGVGLVGAILIFLSGVFFAGVNGGLDTENVVMLVGPILGGILAILGSVLGGVGVYLEMKK